MSTTIGPSDVVLGVDFGTTNSLAAIYNGKDITLFDIDENNFNPKTLKSSIFIQKNGNISVGQKAINEYLEKFEGQEIKTDYRLTDQWEEVIKNVEGDTIRERVVEEYEINLPGRFIISPKRVLPNKFFTGTEAFEKIYTAEDLTFIILDKIKKESEIKLGHEIKNVNIGRPVRFSDVGNDDLAIERITEASKKAGFENISFTYEPIGAAYNFAIRNNENKLGLVFDFGGGTFDTSVIEFLSDHTIKVIANEGVYVGGNKLNDDLIYKKFMHYFGRDVVWGPKNLEIPFWIMESASRWEMSNVLRKRDNIEMLESIRRQATRPHLVENLLTLIKNNLGLSLFLLAEEAKIDLGELENSEIRKLIWEKNNIQIDEEIERDEFKSIVWGDIGRIAQSMRQALEKADLNNEDIQVVIKTGGSSKTFFVNDLLKNIFPNAEIFENDAFTDVTAGLAISGYKLTQ